MRKITALILSVVMFSAVAFGGSVIVSANGIKININGAEKTFDQMPIMESDRVLVPMRGIFEALGAQIKWDEATRTVTGTLEQTSVQLSIGNTLAHVNGQEKTLDVPAMLVNARTMVPVRFISESLGAEVEWIGETQTVMITLAGSNSVGSVVKKIVFDDLDKFENNKDFVIGSTYNAENVTLSTDYDHTTGSGKSLKMADRGLADHRVKLLDVFSEADVGKAFKVSAWIYSPDMDAEHVALGAYGPQGHANAFNPGG